MRMFKSGKGKSIKERKLALMNQINQINTELYKRKSIKEHKLALMNQINQINTELYKIRQLYNKDCVYPPIQAVEDTVSSQFSRG